MPAEQSPTTSAASLVVDQTLEQGGGTYRLNNLASVSPERGYAVSIHDFTLRVPVADFTPEVVEHYATLTQFRVLRDPRLFLHRLYVGTWVNEGVVHLDATMILQSRELALKVAREERQEAIYDFARHCDIPLHTPAEVAAQVAQEAA